MIMGNPKAPFPLYLRLGLIVLVLFFSQVYPYVHFHHSHVDSDLPGEIAALPVETDSPHSHHGHDHEDDHPVPFDGGDDGHRHHHEYDQHVDWHVVRTHSHSIRVHVDFGCIPVQAYVTSAPSAVSNLYRVESAPLPDSVPLDGIDTRGPPSLA